MKTDECVHTFQKPFHGPKVSMNNTSVFAWIRLACVMLTQEEHYQSQHQQACLAAREPLLRSVCLAATGQSRGTLAPNGSSRQVTFKAGEV